MSYSQTKVVQLLSCKQVSSSDDLPEQSTPAAWWDPQLFVELKTQSNKDCSVPTHFTSSMMNFGTTSPCLDFVVGTPQGYLYKDDIK